MENPIIDDLRCYSVDQKDPNRVVKETSSSLSFYERTPIDTPIKKIISLKSYPGFIERIVIDPNTDLNPNYIERIDMTCGGLRIFSWDKSEYTSGTNLFEKYHLNKPFPITNNSYHDVNLSFMYDKAAMIADRIIEEREVVEKYACRDESVELEYWNEEENGVSYGYGVKYEERKVMRNMILKKFDLKTPQILLYYSDDHTDIPKNTGSYDVEFDDHIVRKRSILRFVSGMYGFRN